MALLYLLELMKIRSFIALELPSSLKQELFGQAKILAGQDKRQYIRWLPPENYHLTLAFLGDIDSARLSGLQFALEKKLEFVKAVPCTISVISPFPFSRPKIIAGILERTAELLWLQTELANCVQSYVIGLKRRRFVPHITLGRLKPRAVKSIDLHSHNILLSGVSDAVTLFQSELTSGGAIHTALLEVPLITQHEKR